MNRRHFLSSTVLSSLGAMVLAGSARAFDIIDCQQTKDTACRELAQHREILAQLQAMLSQKDLTEEQRRAILASALCPICGQPLLG